MSDLTELERADEVRRQIEERFRRLVEVMPVAVYVCDTSGNLQSYNNRAVELWGRAPRLGDPAERYCGSLRLYAPDGALVPHQESKMAEVLRTGIEARDLEVVIERPDGSCITVLVNIVPLRNSDGELTGAMNCFQDITDRKRAEEGLRRSERLLERVTKPPKPDARWRGSVNVYGRRAASRSVVGSCRTVPSNCTTSAERRTAARL